MRDIFIELLKNSFIIHINFKHQEPTYNKHDQSVYIVFREFRKVNYKIDKRRHSTQEKSY